MNQESKGENNIETEILEIKAGKSNEEMLNYLMYEYGMNLQSLSKVLDVEVSVLEKFNEKKNTMSMLKRSMVGETLSILYYISEITPDERNKAIIDGLIMEHRIEIDTIAKMADVKKEDIENFRNNSESVSPEIKYKIATLCMFLHFIFKPSEEVHKLAMRAIEAGLNDEAVSKLTNLTLEEIKLLRKLCILS